jgi:hypothetical protein
MNTHSSPDAIPEEPVDPTLRQKRAFPSEETFFNELFYALEPLHQAISPAPDLKNEITLMRILMIRVLKLAEEIDDLSLAIKVLNAVGSAATRIMNLHKTQLALAGDSSDQLNQAIAMALQEVKQILDL